ncbi:putative toxin-antitoxin system toxin component, PIN family [Paracraurococcus lichenis]|uniref:Toxin-antitoxin system toxin component, PIN family n=1 Tax=Paracraurococcus lichenis TaxID=3064888 RepID=A0ABT9EAC6_9PROT|nr:putative toxin-antitoxin system toxin component, PIN family [Paracraurococcus sp. LOR1-02]MDO9713155.1 putative toxin-antitoxin system toxin component, PIN family [Paracraurococcus sp. LOR1-02]
MSGLLNKPSYVIADASSLVRAALTPASAARCLVDTALAYGLLAASGPILDEVEEVLGRPKFERWLPEADRLRFVWRLRIAILLLEPGEAVRACRDPSDDKYLEAALAAARAAGGPEAVVLVSDDRDLLTLDPWRGIRILKPEAAFSLLAHG